MKATIHIIAGICAGCAAALVLGSIAIAQPPMDDPVPSGSSARAEWEQRVLQNSRRTSPILTDYRCSPQQPYQSYPQTAARSPYRLVAHDEIATGDSPEVVPPGQLQGGPIPADDSPMAGAAPDYGPNYGPDGACDDWGDGGGCGDCYEGCGGCWNDCRGHRGVLDVLDGPLFRNLQLFAGAHGFKSPVDQGTNNRTVGSNNGNFGLFEGLNFGAPLGGPWNLGYQVGFSAVQSNFSGGDVLMPVGDGTVLRTAARHQYFLTTGIFQRALCCGMQWGVVFDLQHDAYYDTGNHAADLKQIRSETSYLLPGGINEIGYFGAYNAGGDAFHLNNVKIGLRPTDMFAIFYRRHFESGGEGRVWAGLSGHGDALVGADFSVPLGHSWALENRINYLIPKQGHGVGGQFEEAWGLSMSLVWYPGRPAACALNSPYRPLFGVADNATFMVNASAPQVR